MSLVGRSCEEELLEVTLERAGMGDGVGMAWTDFWCPAESIGFGNRGVKIV